MPTNHREIKASDWVEEDDVIGETDDVLQEALDEIMKEDMEEGFVIGPHGEKRPADPIASIAWALQIGTGQREEEYVDGKKPPPKKRVRIV